MRKIYYAKNERKVEVDRYGGNEATYSGMMISEINDNDFRGSILDSNTKAK